MTNYQINEEKNFIEFFGLNRPEGDFEKFYSIFNGVIIQKDDFDGHEVKLGLFMLDFDNKRLSKNAVIKINNESHIFDSYSGEKSSEYQHIYQKGLQSGIIPFEIRGHLCMYMNNDGYFLPCPDIFYAWAYQEMKLKRVEYDLLFGKYYLSEPRKSEKVHYAWGSNPNKD